MAVFLALFLATVAQVLEQSGDSIEVSKKTANKRLSDSLFYVPCELMLILYCILRTNVKLVASLSTLEIKFKGEKLHLSVEYSSYAASACGFGKNSKMLGITIGRAIKLRV